MVAIFLSWGPWVGCPLLSERLVTLRRDGNSRRVVAMKVALVQNRPRFGAVRENQEGVFRAMGQALASVQGPVDLWVLPELAFTGYQFRDQEELQALAEPADGPTVRALVRMSRTLGGALVAGIAERDGNCFYNSALLVSGQDLVGLYRKVHLFDREKELFTPGDLGFGVFEAAGVRIGMMICFDWVFPEAARSLALAGAQVIAHPANLVLPYCQDAVVTRAIENQVFVATANRLGCEERREGERLLFSGRSRLVAPDGTVILDGPADSPSVLVADIEPSRADDKHITARNHLLADRRPDQYRG